MIDFRSNPFYFNPYEEDDLDIEDDINIGEDKEDDEDDEDLLLCREEIEEWKELLKRKIK